MKLMQLRDIQQLDYATTEAINTLASNIIFSGIKYKTFMITSCNANEGKSFVSFQVSQKLASMGYAVLMVDADLRKSVFVSRYDVETQGQMMGLSHYLAGMCPINDIIYQTNINCMHVVPIGVEVLNSISLLSSPALPELFAQLRNQYDFIIVDAPPVGLVIDAAMIAACCDATLLTVASEKVSRRDAANAVQQIQKSGCEVLGVVLNEVVMNTHKSRKYYYKSYYSHYAKGPYGGENKSAKKSMFKRKTADEQGGAGVRGASNV